jgi:hypothetical protein
LPFESSEDSRALLIVLTAISLFLGVGFSVAGWIFYEESALIPRLLIASASFAGAFIASWFGFGLIGLFVLPIPLKRRLEREELTRHQSDDDDGETPRR